MKTTVEVGSLVPDFKAHSSNGHDVQLSDFAGKKIVIYFYPKDDTPGCTLEGQDFTRLQPEFKKLNTIVFGVSKGTYESQCKFRDKYGFTFELLSDTDEKLCQLFDVIKEKNLYGNKFMGIERSTFIISEDRKLLKEYRKVSANSHAQAVLNDIKEMA